MISLLSTILLLTLPVTPGSTGAMHGQGSFVAIVVRDVEASTRWYQENLGLRLLKKSLSPRGNAGNAVLMGDGLYIELIYFVEPQAKPVRPAADGSVPPGIRKAGAVLDAKSFDNLFARLKKREANFRGGVFEDREMKLRSFIVVDNEGNLIQFFAPVEAK